MEHAETPFLAVAIVAFAFASVHLFSPYLVFLDRTPRSIWLSAAGGVSVSYVFVHLLPEIAHLERETGGHGAGLWLGALVGLVIFYGLERLALRHGGGRDGESPVAAFRLHLGAFAIYNFMIGHLLQEQAAAEGGTGLALYAVAMGLHFVVNDRALYGHHGDRYLERGRWILAGAVLIGWLSGLVWRIPETWLAWGFATLGGSVVLNVIKEELPKERESRFWAFALGAGLYTGLLMI